MFYSRAGTGPAFGLSSRSAFPSTRTADPHSYNQHALQPPRSAIHHEKAPRRITQSARKREMTHRIVDQISFRLAQVPMMIMENPHDFNKLALKPPRGAIQYEGGYSYTSREKRYRAFLEQSGETPPDDHIPKQVFDVLDQLEARGFDKKTLDSMRDKLRRGELNRLSLTETLLYQDIVKRIATPPTTTPVATPASSAASPTPVGTPVTPASSSSSSTSPPPPPHPVGGTPAASPEVQAIVSDPDDITDVLDAWRHLKSTGIDPESLKEMKDPQGEVFEEFNQSVQTKPRGTTRDKFIKSNTGSLIMWKTVEKRIDSGDWVIDKRTWQLVDADDHNLPIFELSDRFTELTGNPPSLLKPR